MLRRASTLIKNRWGSADNLDYDAWLRDADRILKEKK